MNYGLESVCMLCLTVLKRHVYGWLLRGKVLSNEFGDWAIVYTCTRATQNLVHHYTRGSLHVSWTNNNSHKANVTCSVKWSRHLSVNNMADSAVVVMTDKMCPCLVPVPWTGDRLDDDAGTSSSMFFDDPKYILNLFHLQDGVVKVCDCATIDASAVQPNVQRQRTQRVPLYLKNKNMMLY